MRFSIVEGRPGYDPRHSRRVERVEVDGRPVEACIEADEEQGYALCLSPDRERGGFLRDPQGGLVTLRVSGRTVVTLRRGDRDWDKGRVGRSTEVRVGREPGTGDLLVQVHSWARPGAIKQGRLARGAQLDLMPAALAQRCGVVAGAVAEMLCDQFGDRLDPSECARVAVEQASQLLAAERG